MDHFVRLYSKNVESSSSENCVLLMPNFVISILLKFWKLSNFLKFFSRLGLTMKLLQKKNLKGKLSKCLFSNSYACLQQYLLKIQTLDIYDLIVELWKRNLLRFGYGYAKYELISFSKLNFMTFWLFNFELMKLRKCKRDKNVSETGSRACYSLWDIEGHKQHHLWKSPKISRK